MDRREFCDGKERIIYMVFHKKGPFLFFFIIHTNDDPCLALPSGWAGSYTCPALRPYQFGPMRIPKSNQRYK